SEAGADGIIAKPILSIERFGEEILEFMRERLANQATQSNLQPEAQTTPEPLEKAASDEPAGIDREIFDRLCGSFDDATRIELIGKIRADVANASNRIADSIPNKDVMELRAATHILISVAGAIGATKLQTLAQCLNSAGHASDVAAIDRDVPELLSEAKLVLDFVTNSQGG
ncbi:MAG: hypothetical protein AAF479_07800, partial [Pseudomonadota bacterium]